MKLVNKLNQRGFLIQFKVANVYSTLHFSFVSSWETSKLYMLHNSNH